MPHFIAHCDSSILEEISKRELLSIIYEAAKKTKLFNEKDIKVRIVVFDEFISGGNKSPFFHVFAYIMEGRTTGQKKILSQTIVKALNLELKHIPVVSTNVMDFEKETYFNKTMI